MLSCELRANRNARQEENKHIGTPFSTFQPSKANRSLRFETNAVKLIPPLKHRKLIMSDQQRPNPSWWLVSWKFYPPTRAGRSCLDNKQVCERKTTPSISIPPETGRAPIDEWTKWAALNHAWFWQPKSAATERRWSRWFSGAKARKRTVSCPVVSKTDGHVVDKTDSSWAFRLTFFLLIFC